MVISRFPDFPHPGGGGGGKWEMGNENRKSGIGKVLLYEV